MTMAKGSLKTEVQKVLLLECKAQNLPKFFKIVETY
jgi:hypothetical protein